MRFFNPWAPNAPKMTDEAPKRQPVVQNGDAIAVMRKFATLSRVGDGSMLLKAALVERRLNAEHGGAERISQIHHLI